MSRPPTPPRLYCIPALEAPVVAVFRRGPSAWAHVGKWDLDTGAYEPGAWLKARIFPRRSDLSPDGRYLSCFVHDPTATWEYGEAYVAVSRLPWLTALFAFGEDGTWTRGFHFVSGATPDAKGDVRLPTGYRLRPIPLGQFALERLRGWEEAPDSPPRDPTDVWDHRRNARLRKPQPGGECVLCVESEGTPGGEFGVDQAVDGLVVRYALEVGDDLEVLSDVQWADWDATGRLLLATRSGRLQIVTIAPSRRTSVSEVDLTDAVPRPSPSPAWASHW